MVNFNVQDGYSVLSIPKNPAPSDDNELNLDIDSSLLDSFNTIESGQHMGSVELASSVLLVQGVQFKHAGNYTCAPSNTRPTNINVHVLKGKPLTISIPITPLTLIPNANIKMANCVKIIVYAVVPRRHN